MKKLIALALLIALPSFAQVAPYIKNPFSTNATPAASSVFLPAISDESGTGNFLTTFGGGTTNLTSTGTSLLGNTTNAVVGPSAAYVNDGNSVATGKLLSGTGNMLTTLGGKATNLVLVTPSMTNGASAGALMQSDASGNFAWTTTPNLGGATNLNWVNTIGQWRESAWLPASGSMAVIGPTFANSGGAAATYNDSTVMPWYNMVTGAVSNNSAGVSSAAGEIYTAQNLQLIMRWSHSDLTNRFFAGISSGNISTTMASDNPSADFIAVGYSAASGIADTTYKILHRDGTTATSRDETGVSISTNVHTSIILGNSGGTSFQVYLDGALVGTVTNNLPRTNVVSLATIGIGTQAAAAKTGRVHLMRFRTALPLY